MPATNKPTLIIITLALLLIIGGFIHFQQRTIPVLPANADVNVFSGGRAFAELQDLLQEGVPHPVDSQANRRVEQRIVSKLRALGYTEDIQTNTVCRQFQRGETRIGFSRCVNVRNIIVHIPGTNPGNGILLSAHYDSVPAAPGASDAGAAVATLLEIARLLQTQAPPRNSIVLLFNEGEETGLHGAKLFMEQHPLAKQLQVAINIEARGTTSRSVLFETGENSGWLIDHYAATTPAPLSSSLFYEIYKVLPNDTDLTVYKEHGLQGINFAHADNEAHYHTPLDNLDNLDSGSLQHHGDNAWGVLQRIKDLDLTAVKPGNLVYTDIVGLFVIRWPESASIQIAGALALALLGLSVKTYRRNQWQLRVFALALVVIVLTTLTCLAASFAMQWLAQTLSGQAQPWRASSLPMEICLWSVNVFVGLAFGFWTRRWRSGLSVLLAILWWWLVLAAISSVYLAGISFLFILPVLFSLAAVFVQAYLPKIKLLNVIDYLVPPFVTAILFLPVAYFIEVSMGFQLSVVVGLLLSFVAVTLLPLASVTTIKPTHLAVICATVFAVSFGGLTWTINQKPFTTYKPQPLNLIYLQQDNQANIVAETTNPILPNTLTKALAEQGNLQNTNILPWSSTSYQYAPIENYEVEGIDVNIVANKVDALTKTITFNLNLASASHSMSGTTLLIPASSQLQQITYNQQTIDYSNTIPAAENQYIFQCMGQSCGQQQLTLRFMTTEPINLSIATHRSGLPRALTPLANSRTGLAIQRQLGDQTIILSKVTL